MRTNNRMFRYCSTRASAIAMALASGPFALACSSDYAIGELADEGYPLDNQEPEVAAGGDSILSPLLPPPDVSIPAEGMSMVPPASIGDLDGDGFDDFAVTHIGQALTSIFSNVHIRYGGPRPQGPVEAAIFAESGAKLMLDVAEATVQKVVRAGDVNADGYADLLVQMVPGCGAVQQAFLIYGSAERLQAVQRLDAVGRRFSGLTPSAPRVGGCGNTSTHVEATGDFDGDGFDDFTLTETPPGPDEPGPSVTYLFYGREQAFAPDTPLESADAILRSDLGRVNVYAAGDVNGDDLADLILGSTFADGIAFWLPGRTERLSGALELTAAATELEGVRPFGPYYSMPSGPGDLDGDGLNEVLLADTNDAMRLFYGAPALFANGIQLSDAAATLGRTDSEFQLYPGATGDRDGDGDDELFAVFTSTNATDVALLSGSAARLEGDVAFELQSVRAQRPNGPFPEHAYRELLGVSPAGDLDGDGAADLFSESYIREDGTSTSSWLLHIHYGTVSAASTPEPR